MDELGLQVVVVTFEGGYLARAYAEEQGLAWPVLVDESRRLYQAYGMLQARFWEIWGPRTWWAYLSAMARGEMPRRHKGDTGQRGGDVLIDPDSIVRLHHVGRGPADRPPVGQILQRLESAGRLPEEESQ